MLSASFGYNILMHFLQNTYLQDSKTYDLWKMFIMAIKLTKWRQNEKAKENVCK